MPYILFIIICTIWGASFILMKKAGLALGPVSIGAWRVISGAIVLAILWRLRTTKINITWRHVPHIAVVALVGYSWPYAIQPYLVIRYGSGFIGMMIAFVPLLTILVSVPMLGVYPSRRQLLGVVGGIICLAVIMADGLNRQVPVTALLLAVSVPLGYSIGNTYIRRKLQDIPSMPMTAIALGIAGVVLLPLSCATELLEPFEMAGPTGPLDQRDWIVSIASILMLGIMGTGIAMYIFNKLIQEHGPLFAGMVTYLIPLGAVFWGGVDNEQITITQLAALAGLLTMVAIVQYGSAKSSD